MSWNYCVCVCVYVLVSYCMVVHNYGCVNTSKKENNDWRIATDLQSTVQVWLMYSWLYVLLKCLRMKGAVLKCIQFVLIGQWTHSKLYTRTHMVFDTLFPLLLLCVLFVALVLNSCSGKRCDVIVLPYERVQTAQTRYPYTAACALRDKMAAHFVLLFMKPSQHYAEIIQMLVARYGKSDYKC